MAAPDQIHARVTSVLVQSLGVDEDDVTPAATLLGDLGAESIDLLDIVFRLEREFAIAIPRGELFIEPDSAERSVMVDPRAHNQCWCPLEPVTPMMVPALFDW